MSRYINAEPWESMSASVKFEYPNKCGDTLTGHIMMRDIHTADVVPVVHGRWEFLGPNRLVKGCMCGTCSVCKVRSKYIVNPMLCPNCGAKMDVTETNNKPNLSLLFASLEDIIDATD